MPLGGYMYVCKCLFGSEHEQKTRGDADVATA